uniref:Uncharacterized protein n=1 Tax=Alexandrium catenella TaxID=2925 RepID=A0A7S1SGH4_ALECA
MGMAFTDELLMRTSGCTVLLVDKRAQPGGHWNVAYPYVRLHQPSHFYGVNSMKLEKGPAKADGENELASGVEVVSYFQRVLDSWKGSGRVRFMPMCEVDESGRRITSLVEPGRSWEARVRRKVVDATYMNVEVPATTPPKYAVAPGALLIPPNGLPSLREPHPNYVVIGAGKTGMDAVAWLLRHGVAPERLRWVMPRDPWMFNRKWAQPYRMLERTEITDALLGFGGRSPALDGGEEAVGAEALRRERMGLIFRVDEGVWPEAFACATVSEEELAEMRRVKDSIIRMGRVREVGVERLLLDNGEVATGEGTLHVDCTADGLTKRPAVPIFAAGRITLQPVTYCQQVMGAALLAYVESQWPDDDARKNDVLVPCPHPDGIRDWLLASEIQWRNLIALIKSGHGRWVLSSRLSLAAASGLAPALKYGVTKLLFRTPQERAKL